MRSGLVALAHRWGVREYCVIQGIFVLNTLLKLHDYLKLVLPRKRQQTGFITLLRLVRWNSFSRQLVST